MSWRAIATAMESKALLDTGDGGLFEPAGLNRITGFHTTIAPVSETMPYIVITPVRLAENKSFSTDVVEALIQISVWCDRVTQGLTGSHIHDRVRELYDREPLTASGWSIGPGVIEEQRVFESEGRAVQYMTDIAYIAQKD